MPKVKVQYRKIQRHAKQGEQLYGLAWLDEKVIDIEVRLQGYQKLYALIHEYTHFQFPDWSETKVTKHSKSLAWFLWKQGVGKQNKSNKKPCDK
jgi:hypothetical protein